MEVSGRHARTRAITCDTVSPANQVVAGRGDASGGVARVVSDVSVSCPRTVARTDNRRPWAGRSADVAPLEGKRPKEVARERGGDGSADRSRSACAGTTAQGLAACELPVDDGDSDRGRRLARVCGCMVDRVDEELLTRLEGVLSISNRMLPSSLWSIAPAREPAGRMSANVCSMQALPGGAYWTTAGTPNRRRFRLRVPR
jgi:hypothetical protein